MSTYCLSHLPDPVLLRDLAALVAQDRTTTAALLAHLAEVDERRLYLPAGYPSMYSYCVGELRLSEEAACKRIRAARAARRFPAIFDLVADGRLHLSAVVMLAPHLKPESVDELIAAAAHKAKAEIEQLLAERHPRPDLPMRLEAIPPAPPVAQPAPAPVEQPAPGRVATPVPRPKVAPLAPERFALQLTISKSTHDKLQYARALLSHTVSSGDLAQVLDRALGALIVQLEKRRFAATDRPRRARPCASLKPRHIPAHVRRAVWERDRGQCTFVSETGHRCAARMFLEFDHVEEVARGGRASVEGVRLRCRAHNQYEAERTFGVEFMRHKREEARRAVVASRAKARAREQAAEVIPWLRALGFHAGEARHAAALCENIPAASLEERVRVALSHLAPRASSAGRVATVCAGSEA